MKQRIHLKNILCVVKIQVTRCKRWSKRFFLQEQQKRFQLISWYCRFCNHISKKNKKKIPQGGVKYWVNQNFRELTVQMFSAPPCPCYSHGFCTWAEQVWMQMVDDAGIFSTQVRVEVWKQQDRPCQGSKEIFAGGNDFVWRSQHLGISSAWTEACRHTELSESSHWVGTEPQKMDFLSASLWWFHTDG